MKSPHRKLLDTLIEQHQDRLTGRTLNVGGGTHTYREYAEDMVTMDYYGENPSGKQIEADVVADATKTFPFTDAEFDSVICTQLLEHIADPTFTVSEIARVLKPGGNIILSTPFLERYHPDPNDYWRFTRQGLEQILKPEFGDMNIQPVGGKYLNMLSFMHQNRVPKPVIALLEPIVHTLTKREKEPERWTIILFATAKKK